MTESGPWRVRALLAASILGLCFATAVGQDLATVAPHNVKVEHEDARVRVVRLHIPEHASLPTHDRPRRVVVSLTANDVRLTRANGTVSETHTEAGSVAWSEPTVRSVQNLGGPLENIVVEMKSPEPPADGPAASPTKALVEPYHHLAFENRSVRVYDVRIPPGEVTVFHRHAYDQLSVYVSGGRTTVQREGEPWGPPATITPGGVAFAAHASTPLTHRVRNDGPSEYHVILVQLLD